MDEREWLAEHFESQRPRLRAVAYRMLGSTAEAEDAVQDTWLRLSRADTADVDNLDGWLTTVVARVSLNMLRARRQRREDPLDVHVPDPVVDRDAAPGPEQEAVLADSVGLALLVVLESLSPVERLAFVLHDMFAVPFEEIAPMVDRSPDAARQLASRARRRVQGRAPSRDADRTRHRAVVDAFFAAAREGSFEELLSVLDPDVVLRSDGGAARRALSVVITGAPEVASQAVGFGKLSPFARPALVNGAAGVVVVTEAGPLSIMGFTVVDATIVAIDVLADPERLQQIDLSALDG